MSGKRKRDQNFYRNQRKEQDKRAHGQNEEDGDDDRFQISGERHPGSYPLDEVKGLLSEEAVNNLSTSVKRKYALCFGYLGTNYQGLQINPGVKTIEMELEKALFLAGMITEANFGYMSKIQWTRCARTDSGVHAVSQCCAMKLLMAPELRESFICKLNALLPSEIQIFGMNKVMKSFNAKNHCTKRTYHYLLPSYVLEDVHIINSILSEALSQQGYVKGAGAEGGYVDLHSSKCLHKETLSHVYHHHCKNYRITEEKLQVLQNALAAYQGTFSYHNFTSGKDSSEANAKRYMISFTGEKLSATACNSSSTSSTSSAEDGIEWLLLSVTGQSFLLNQIRKMIGFAIAITRGETSLESLQVAFAPEKFDTPMAPSLGLYLNELYFEGYNLKQVYEKERDQHRPTASNSNNNNKSNNDDEDGGDNNREILDWSNDITIASRMKAFREEILYPHIMKQESESLAFMYYLDYHRAYPLSFIPKANKKPEVVGTESDTKEPTQPQTAQVEDGKQEQDEED